MMKKKRAVESLSKNKQIFLARLITKPSSLTKFMEKFITTLRYSVVDPAARAKEGEREGGRKRKSVSFVGFLRKAFF